ncbi:hypothetical protein SAMN05518668_104362 [Sphingobium sp. YR657]|uniref:hypothetical protein n=1 Tax=Sphingobium sp. YR657 TaxID=1884366 RepID=UPI000919648F|nr:hypothetical protein [Sphingobium sp. YR657]SHL96655.1 hypothetical protein SAMN05518668_104362 [Sphingobium sp. YR657]
MRAIILILAMASVPAQAADQFDLVCTSEKATVRYRVDLQKKEVCSDSCESIWRMGDSTAGELFLIDQKPAYSGDLEEQSVVNRQSGAWRYNSRLRGKLFSRDGHCEPAPFSGFPAAKF